MRTANPSTVVLLCGGRGTRRQERTQAIPKPLVDVFHLAAQTIGGVVNRSPPCTLETNIRGTWTLLEACRTIDVQRVVVPTSDRAYGI
jgi:nucleoside-diphosphate-sugar epimerase